MREWQFIHAWLDEQNDLLESDINAEDHGAFAQRTSDIKYYTRKLMEVEGELRALGATIESAQVVP